ncbi:MAG: PHP domain-containing protein, partial [Planctomycetota bacterium]
TVMDHFESFTDVAGVIVRGDTKMSVRNHDEFQIDLRVVPDESFGAALQYFTGSKEHNVVVRGRAKSKGLRVNEWGVFEVDGDEQKWIAGRNEAEVYEVLDLPCFHPEIRENRIEFAAAEANVIPDLIELDAITGDLHMHSTATDGRNSIEEMAHAARQSGLKFIAITDHSKRVSMANGLDEERLLEQWRTIDQINKESNDDFVILKGIECDILESGGMDLPDSVLSQADWVIGSLHYGQTQPRAQITDRIIGAVENEFVSMIAHPTGRLINRRPPYEVDMEAVFQAAAENQKFLELNASPQRLDLHDVHLAAAKSRNIPIVINTDAHSIGGLGNMRFGIKQARRGGLAASDVANTMPWNEMQALLGR